MLRQPVIYPDDDLLTLPQAARALHVAPMTVRVWVLEGRIPARRFGRMIAVRRGDVEAYIATRREEKSKAAVSA